MSPILRALLLALLAGCGGEAMLDAAETGDDGSPHPSDTTEADVDPLPVELRLDVLPSQLLDGDGLYRVFPRTLGPILVLGDQNVGNIPLAAPVALDGEVLGELVTPIASGATLPAVIEPIAASVTILREGSVQSYATSTDDDGLFSSLVAPDDDYELVVVPDDPNVPFLVQDLRVGQVPAFQDLLLEQGVGVYGQVLDDLGSPLADVEVYAVDESGVRGASTFTDDEGRYLLRVVPDHLYDVVAAGRPNPQQDPVLRVTSVDVGDVGAEVDFDYTDLAPVYRSGAVADADGEPLGGVIVRFESKMLDGYPDEPGTVAQLAVETVTSDGNFTVRLIAGTYQVQVLPPPSDDPTTDHSPLLIADLVVEGSPDLGTLALAPFVNVSGFVRTPNGDAIPQARVSCREEGFDHRQWTTYANDNGRYDLVLPQVPVICEATPDDAYRAHYAVTPTRFEPQVEPTKDLLLVEGTRISGTVTLDGAGEPYAVVEVRTPADELLGSALTDEHGDFEVRVALP